MQWCTGVSRTWWHHCMGVVTGAAMQAWNTQPERAMKHCCSACCYVPPESMRGYFSPIHVKDFTVVFMKDEVRASTFFPPPSPPLLSAPVVMQHDGLMANVLPPLTPRTPWHLFNTTTGRIREKKGRGTARQQWKTARQEDLRVWESLLLSFDQAVQRLKLFQHTAQVRR